MNNVKTAMLLAGLMALFIYIGSFWGQNGMIMALIMGGMMNVIAYFFSDKIALATMGAKEVSEQNAPELVGMVRSLAQRAVLPMPRVYIAPTDVPNAFATGRNPKHAVVCVTAGIMKILDRNELEGVVGHELSHIKHYDMLISTVAATIAGAISMLPYMLRFVPIGGRDGEGRNPFAGLLMIIIAPIVAAIIQMAISRKREYNADNGGAELAGNPYSLATALEKLDRYNKRMPMPLPNPAQANLFIVEPFLGGGLSALFSTHPKTEKRVQALIGRPSTGLVR